MYQLHILKKLPRFAREEAHPPPTPSPYLAYLLLPGLNFRSSACSGLQYCFVGSTGWLLACTTPGLLGACCLNSVSLGCSGHASRRLSIIFSPTGCSGTWLEGFMNCLFRWTSCPSMSTVYDRSVNWSTHRPLSHLVLLACKSCTSTGSPYCKGGKPVALPALRCLNLPLLSRLLLPHFYLRFLFEFGTACWHCLLALLLEFSY